MQVQAPEPRIKEEKLIELLRNENTRDEGFRHLMAGYQERLYLHIRRMVGAHEDANDVLQNCLVKVYRNIAQFNGRSALYTWLYRIAANEAISFLKQRQRRTARTISTEEPSLLVQLRADAWMDAEEVQLKLRQAMEALPDRQRQVFVMRYFDELSYQEMAEILHTSVGGLKASYHHAVKKIEHFLINTIT